VGKSSERISTFYRVVGRRRGALLGEGRSVGSGAFMSDIDGPNL
jgi:hypothetical protein